MLFRDLLGWNIEMVAAFFTRPNQTESTPLFVKRIFGYIMSSCPEQRLEEEDLKPVIVPQRQL
jgi:hypothetical protein